MEAAAALREEHRDGAWLVELASVAQSGEVAPAAASALEASSFAGPQPTGSATQLIVRHLAGRSLVVVLDNCEHVIGEAAVLADTLLGAVPGLRLIATSREPLGIPGEVLVLVGGLAPPAAAELFADRARAVRPGFLAIGQAADVIEDICRRLDGLPLAVELAAARLRALPLATLDERLGDRFRLLTGGARTALPRQQTLRAVVDWSYDLLFEDERRLFARLAVFTGGCGLAAAEAVCGDEHLPAGEILDALSRLVDKSLVTASGTGGEARFSQLQTLWQYGRERLGESGEADAMRARHGAHFLQMAEDAHEGLRGAAGPMWRDRLTSELGNLRAALDWYVATGDADAALSLTSGMAWLWYINGDLAEGARWLGDALGTRGRAFPNWERPPTSGTAISCACPPARRLASSNVRRPSPRCGSATTEFAWRRRWWSARRCRSRARVQPITRRAGQGSRSAGTIWPPVAPRRARHGTRLEPAVVGTAGRRGGSGPFEFEGFDALGEVWLVFSPLTPSPASPRPGGTAMAPRQPTSRSWKDAAQPGSAYTCRRAWPAWPRCGPGKATTLQLTVCTPTRSPAASTRGCLPTPWSARRRLPVASVTCRGPGPCSTPRAVTTGRSTFPPASPVCSRAWPGARWPPATQTRAAVFAAEAAEGASASGDPAAQLLAETAVTAVKAVADPTSHNIDAFVALARRRTQGAGVSLSYRRTRCDRARRPPHAGRRLTSAPPQRRLGPPGTLRLCSHRHARVPAAVIICPPPDPPLRTTAGSSPPTPGRPGGTAGRSEPPAAPGRRSPAPGRQRRPRLRSRRRRSGGPHRHTGPAARGQAMNWERHHIEVVATAAAGQATRAADLLREHLASVGCDPLAIRIVARLQPSTRPGDDFEDLAGFPRLSRHPMVHCPMTP